MELIAAISASILVIALAIVLAGAAWKIFLAFAARSIDSVRDRGQVDKVQVNYNRFLYLIAQERKRKITEQKYRFTDLSGQTIYLTVAEQKIFKTECIISLGLALIKQFTKAEVRNYWRKNVINWHPDQGGDVEQWLVKLRAYEALMLMNE